jgi:hypothetical protein
MARAIRVARQGNARRPPVPGEAEHPPDLGREHAHRDQLDRLVQRRDRGPDQAGDGRREDHLLGRLAALLGDPEAAVGEPAVDVGAQAGVVGGHRVVRQAEHGADAPVSGPVALAVLAGQRAEDPLVVDQRRVGKGGEDPEAERRVGGVVGGPGRDRPVVLGGDPADAAVHRLHDPPGLFRLLDGAEVDPRHPLVGAPQAQARVVEDDRVPLEADHPERFAGLHQQGAHPGEEDDALAVEAAHYRVRRKEAVDLGGAQRDDVVAHIWKGY